MIEHDAFETAADNARAEIETTVSMETDDDATTQNGGAEEEISTPVRRARGRPRGRSRRRSSSRRTRAPRAAQAPDNGNADDQREQAVSRPKVEATVVLAPIPPEKVVPLLRQIDKTFVRLLNTSPLDEQELKDGAEACAPVLDYYAPLFLSKPWAGAAIWAGMVYAPRVVEVYDRRKAGGGRKSESFPAATPESSDPTATRKTVVGN